MIKRFGSWRRAGLALAVLAAVPVMAAAPAKAWWGPYPYGYAPVPYAPVAVAPPVLYAPPVVYGRPAAIWVRPHWFGGRFYPGYWR